MKSARPWDGSTWTKEHPANHPSDRLAAAMAYDPATGNVVLFGGMSAPGHPLSSTWVRGSGPRGRAGR